MASHMTLPNIRAAMAARDWPKALDLLSGLVQPEYRLASVCHTELEEFDQALALAQTAAMTDPKNAATWYQLGVVHQLMAASGPDHYLEAHICFERAFTMAQDTPTSAMGLAASAVTMGQYDMALNLFERAQKLAPYPLAQTAEAGVLLLRCSYAGGWEKFEARIKMAEGTQWPAYRGTVQDLRDRTVVVRAEQRYGDILQFMRYIPQLRPFCRKIICEVHSGLEALCAAFTQETTVPAPYVADHEAISINILSLPLLLGPAIGWQPLRPLAVPGQFLRSRSGIGACPATVVLATGSGAAYANAVARRKCLPSGMIEALAKDFGPFRSLMHEDLDTADWFETATVVAGLSLVITVDTAIAHLAASLGIETWVLQRFDHCWRWNEGWYPMARIFKQSTPGDWGSVFRQVHQALSERMQVNIELP